MDAAGTTGPGDLLVVDDRIAALGPGVPAALAKLPGGRADRTFDASDTLVTPGFVHAHLHLCQTLFRGRAEQSDLLRWLRERIWPLEWQHTEVSLAASVRLALLEMLSGGVTCFNDMGTTRHTDVIGQVLADTGVRATFGQALMDVGEGVPAGMAEPAGVVLERALAVADRWHGHANGRLRVSLAPRFILSCSESLWADVRDASRERGLLVHTHIAEAPSEGAAVKAAVGCHAAHYFAKHDLLSERFLGAHGVWLDDAELDLVARADAALVHCPGSNLKLGSGLADVGAWRAKGIRCGLGSDGAACNNRLDTFAEMGLAGGIARVKRRDAPLGARDVLALATIEGARALGIADETGSLEVGKQADLAVTDVEGPYSAPFAAEDPYTALVYGACQRDVLLTVVAGRVLYERETWSTLDPNRVNAEAKSEARALLRRAEAAGMK
ncbi:MAG: amidohydrolase family protein [Candidatus Eisenbacteria bacterium]|nr:amidohydrolase family protein [Candidatus Eisenbacteria bacterium]